MRALAVCALALLLAHPAAPVARASGSSVTLSEVLSSVDQHYPLIRAAVQDREKAEADLLSARGGFDPTLRSGYQAQPSGEYENRHFDVAIEQATPYWGARLFTGYRQGRGSFGPYDEKLLTNSEGELRAGAQVPILRGGATDERRARLASGERALEASEASLELQKIESRRQATFRYVEWLAAGERLAIARSLVQLANDRDRALEARVRRGDAARIERTDNQRSVIQRDAGLISAIRGLERAALELSIFLRDAQGRPRVPHFDELPAKGLELPRAIPEARPALHPEISRIRAQIEQNEVERRLARNAILPRLDAELSVSKDYGAGSLRKGITEYRAGLQLEVPLLFRSARGRFEGTEAQRVKLEAQQVLARDRVRMALADSLQAMEAARRRVEMTRKEVELATEVEEAERIKFRHGDSNVLTVNLREQATADAKVRAVDALADFHRAWADYQASNFETD